MVVGVLQVEIRLPNSHSLKEKRWTVKSIVTRLRNKFNVSVSETDEQDKWQLATLVIAHIGNGQTFSNQILDQALNFVLEIRQIEVIDSKLEFI